jgi:CheY-like chemotaxis protein
VQERHGTGSIPVIMFSGQADNSQDDAVARGAQGFVGKPFNPQELISRTKELLRP